MSGNLDGWRTLTYDGPVTLRCEEGGHAEYAIELIELRGTGDTERRGISAIFRAGDAPTLAALLEQHAGEPDQMGDAVIPRAQITVEILEPPA